jgi:hypothetical protein
MLALLKKNMPTEEEEEEEENEISKIEMRNNNVDISI